MTAIDHFRRGQSLLAEAEQTPAGTLSAKLLDQARAHFDAARTLIAAINALDMPAHDYEAWEKIALASQQPTGPNLREFELDACDARETTGHPNVPAVQGRRI